MGQLVLICPHCGELIGMQFRPVAKNMNPNKKLYEYQFHKYQPKKLPLQRKLGKKELFLMMQSDTQINQRPQHNQTNPTPTITSC